MLAVQKGFKKGRFYAKFYANLYANLRQALYFGLFFMEIYMLILKVSSFFCLITSMISRGTLELQYTCSARLMVYSLISVQTIVLWLCYKASWHITGRQLKTKGCIYHTFLWVQFRSNFTKYEVLDPRVNLAHSSQISDQQTSDLRPQTKRLQN